MMLGVALGGLVLLVVIAGIVGHIDARARSSAWARIDAARNQRPTARRGNPEHLDRPMCRSCETGRPAADRHLG
jgi:hypothetical protein